MNKTFDIKRFGNVLRYDAMSYFQKFGWTLLILFAIPIGIWFLLYTNFHDSADATGDFRYVMLNALFIIAMILAPSRLYKTCNDSRRGIQFAMMPASTLEKFLSMLFYCALVTPLLYIAGFTLIDTILTLIPGSNPYEGFIFKYFSHNDLVRVGDSDMTEYAQEIKLPLQGLFAWLAYVSIFIFTNMVFKKRKVSKTIGILALIGIVIMVIFIRSIIRFEDLDFATDEAFIEYFKLFIKRLVYASYVWNIILSSVMLYFTYYKIRKQKY